ncbi:MAG: UMP kinase [Planctomycetes bacterium]|nr:UMP kinase [Planctomycetota bacterium]
MARRVLLKLSGEGLCGPSAFGFDPDQVRAMGAEIAALPARGIEAAVVVGAGNLVRGRDLPADLVPRTAADAVGMLATTANALVLAEAIRRAGCPARVLTAVPMPDVAESFTADRARALMGEGEAVVLAGGTGRPFFTTDTAAALRALEVGAEVLLKATTVDGVYDRDPRRDPAAVRFERLSFEECIERRLGVMDMTAFTLCRENRLPVVVFALRPSGNLARAAAGEPVGTRIG